MKETCGQSITTKEQALSCLSNFEWASIESATSTEEIKEGFIKIGEDILHDEFEEGAIKVFQYERWSIDNDGNLYLNAILG